jgi:hypothetical protein
MRLHLVKSITMPIPRQVRKRLDTNSQRLGFRWKDADTLYEAMFQRAVHLCRKAGIVNAEKTAEDCVQTAIILICRISQRDGRSRPTDRRQRAGKRTKGEPASKVQSMRPVFTDWVKYTGWVLGQLKLTVREARRAQTAEIARFVEFVEDDIPESLPDPRADPDLRQPLYT